MRFRSLPSFSTPFWEAGLRKCRCGVLASSPVSGEDAAAVPTSVASAVLRPISREDRGSPRKEWNMTYQSEGRPGSPQGCGSPGRSNFAELMEE
jgi:hypothetical protein